ncbi:MAG: hypothetical protein CVV64_17515 [Candidatus Wallbacteria bacterium HGW-Wallbacteria-1]|uniref:Uncharacterized protein n=1 Tax=Candidatus Wallbacteria bacterium HGW-Wallbacteria-1 TaxID=2013854 RepID=A0A2N1PK58_9BACT|nr:MAG: hypothetical protein CVV64_17515 [Candidatus Wallbacteria bacterium HGW-Wallbacteria-1]
MTSHDDDSKKGFGSLLGKALRRAGEKVLASVTETGRAAADVAGRGMNSATGELRRAGAGLASGIGENKRALDLLRRNLKLNSADDLSRLQLATLLLLSNQYEEAAEVFDPLAPLLLSETSRFPGNVDYSHYLAVSALISEKTGDLRGSLAGMMKFLDAGSGDETGMAMSSELSDEFGELMGRIVTLFRESFENESDISVPVKEIIDYALALLSGRPSLSGRALRLLETILERVQLSPGDGLSVARAVANARLKEHDYCRASVASALWADWSQGMERVRALETGIKSLGKMGRQIERLAAVRKLRETLTGKEGTGILDRALYARVSLSLLDEMVKGDGGKLENLQGANNFLDETLETLRLDRPDDPGDRESLAVAERQVHLLFRMGNFRECLERIKTVESVRGPVSGFTERKIKSLLALGMEERALPLLLDYLVTDERDWGQRGEGADSDLAGLAGILALGLARKSDQESMARLLRRVLPYADFTPPAESGPWAELISGVLELSRVGDSTGSVTNLAAALEASGNFETALKMVVPLVCPYLVKLSDGDPDWTSLTSRYWALASQCRGNDEENEASVLSGPAASILLKCLAALNRRDEAMRTFLLLFKAFDRGDLPKWSIQNFVPLLDLLPSQGAGCMAGAWLLIRLGRFSEAVERVQDSIRDFEAGVYLRELVCAGAVAMFRTGNTQGARDLLNDNKLDPVQRLEIMKSALIAGDYSFVLASPHSLDPSSCKEVIIRRDVSYIRAISAEKAMDYNAAMEYYRIAMEGMDDYRDCAVRLKRLESMLARRIKE